MPSLMQMAKRQLTLSTHRIHTLPIVVMMPHSKCNCRCVMCDIWKANKNGQELSIERIEAQLDNLRRLKPQQIVLSGGEALMHSNLWRLCEVIRSIDPTITITLLSTGLLLKKYAAEVVQWCDEAIVSLDGSKDIHDAIRRIPRAYDRLAEGIEAVHQIKPDFRITGRCVLQRMNYQDLPNIIEAAHELGLQQISFLGADVSTEAFNRSQPWDDEQTATVSLTPEEAANFSTILEDTIERYADDFTTDFIAEKPDKLRRIITYYEALNGDATYPTIVCNAPWVSTVIEADGTVRPCFFHGELGNINQQPLAEIINSPEAITFRRTLDVSTNEICRKCVCTLNLNPRTHV